MLENGLVGYALDKGGMILSLLVPLDNLGPSLMNPSIIKVNDQLILNLRNVNYVLYHAENNKNEHIWGPLCYLHPEDDITLTTKNVLCYLDNDGNITNYSITDYSYLDSTPLWSFIGLEDARLVYWQDKLYACGVRRDTTTNGQGRMELSHILHKENKSVEINRIRIPAPGNNDSYCEKNWMPVLDQPYTWVKWTNPTEVVKYDLDTNTTTSIIMKNFIQCENCNDFRGGSQVIPYNNGYLALIHEVGLYNTEKGNKDGIYRHRFVFWDRDFNLMKVSPIFHFMGAKVEFASGLCEHQDNFLITFGFQDNASFLLRCPKFIVNELLSL